MVVQEKEEGSPLLVLQKLGKPSTVASPVFGCV